jgi:hypothetical protein
MYSFRMSFWTVPLKSAGETPCFSATAMYKAIRMMAVALMVMEVLTRSSGIPSNRASMS